MVCEVIPIWLCRISIPNKSPKQPQGPFFLNGGLVDMETYYIIPFLKSLFLQLVFLYQINGEFIHPGAVLFRVWEGDMPR